MSWRLRAGKPPEGWGEDPDKIEALIKDDPEALRMWREVVKTHGGDRKSEQAKIKNDNISLDKESSHGTASPHPLTPQAHKAGVVPGGTKTKS
jgi:hypothetical protein